MSILCKCLYDNKTHTTIVVWFSNGQFTYHICISISFPFMLPPLPLMLSCTFCHHGIMSKWRQKIQYYHRHLLLQSIPGPGSTEGLSGSKHSSMVMTVLRWKTKREIFGRHVGHMSALLDVGLFGFYLWWIPCLMQVGIFTYILENEII